MLNQILKILFALPLLVVILLVAWINVNLNDTRSANDPLDTVNVELLHELRGLKESINNGGDEDMQQLYPEGYIFLNALYGLAWCNTIEELKPSSLVFLEGKSEIERTWQRINSDHGRSPFDESLPLKYGAFYVGWSNYFLGRKLGIPTIEQLDEREVRQFKEQCTIIDSVFKLYTYPVTYRGNAWPADAIMCIASLSLHDKLFTPKYQTTIRNWVESVKSNLDSRGLIPHSVRALNGMPSQHARGSSQSLMLIFLSHIDPDFAKEQFLIYRNTFIDTTVGLTGVREFPKGQFGFGDVDSGPLIFGYGASATIVGMQTLSLYGDYSNAARIRHLVESFGFSFENGDKKKYLLGTLPIADAFIAWAHSTKSEVPFVEPSFLLFHLWSGLIILLLSIFFWLLVANRKPDSKDSLTVLW